MIVLTSGKDASIAYCLTTALYCPLPEQYLAIARHKTIRRERKNPHSLFYSSPFTKSSETPINTGVPRGEELAQLFTTLHPLFTWIVLFIGLQKISAHQLISTCTTGVGRAHISCYASAQQLLCGWKDRLFRLILLVLLATSKGYSEDYLH